MSSFWEDKNVFVTGATGILGSELVRSLVRQQANVTILMRDWVPGSRLVEESLLRRVNVVRGSLEDYFLILRSLAEYEIDTVFHLGAQTIVGTANQCPLPTFKANIEGTWNVLEAVRNTKSVERVVVASSDKAYGSQEALPYTEEAPLKGEHPYDVSKSCSDLITQAYFKTYGLPVAITRCGNIYGPGDLNFNRLIPGTIKYVIFNQQPIIRSDGHYIRDYIYLKDVVDGYLIVAENLHKKGVAGEAFNISTENKLEVIEIVELILKLMKSKLKPKILNIVKDEIKYQYLSTEKARKVLGWSAKYDIKQGLKETIAWYKNFFSKKNTLAFTH